MFLWRPVIAGKLTFTELHTYISLKELTTLHKLLDLQEEYEQAQYKKLNR